MKARYFIIPSIILSLQACSGSEINPAKLFESKETVAPSVVYGSDDRMDYYQIADVAWQERAASTVALISASKVVPDAVNGGYTIKSMVYGKSLGLCKSEPFYDQISSAFCSGSLIAPDIIMTAGHCIRNLKSCQSTKFVFGFSYAAAGVHPQTASEQAVYSCKELIHSESTNVGNSDFALIRLDREVAGRNPLPVRRSGRVTLGEPLVVIGYPKGLPVKMAGGAQVRSNYHRYFFTSNLDTYDGNSGSAVFNENTGEIEGILVRGEQDYIFKDGCYTTNVCGDGECRGEDVTRVSEALKYVDPSEL